MIRASPFAGPEAVVQTFLDLAMCQADARDVDSLCDVLADDVIDAGIRAHQGEQCASASQLLRAVDARRHSCGTLAHLRTFGTSRFHQISCRQCHAALAPGRVRRA